MSTANRVIKNTGYLYAKMGITMFISLYTTRLILNSLGATDFGIFNIVGGAIAMLGFLNASMASATQRFMSYAEGEGNKDKQKNIFNVSFMLHLLISLLVGIVLLIAGYFFFNGILNIPADRVFAAKVIYWSLIVSTMFTVMTVPYDAVMNAHENMKYYALVGIVESLLKLAVALVVVYTLSDKLIIYGILMACIPLITLTIMRVYCHRHYVECVVAPRKYWHKGLMKEMTSFAGWSFLSTASMMFTNYGLGIIVNMFYGVILNATIGIAQQIDAQLKTFSNTLLKAIEPIIVKSEGAQTSDHTLNITIASSKFSFFMFSFFVIPIFIEMPYILKLWLKNIPEWSITFCRLQLIASLFGQVGITFNSAISAHGNIKNFSILTSLLYLSSIIQTYLFFKLGFPPYYLYISVILLNVITFRIMGFFFLHKAYKLQYKDFHNKVIIPCSLTFIITFITSASFLFIESGLLRFICIFIANLISFWICFYYIGMNRKERNILLSIIKKVLKQ